MARRGVVKDGAALTPPHRRCTRAFVRRKRVRGKGRPDRLYYEVVSTSRDGRRVRQQTLASLGPHPSIEAATRALVQKSLELQVDIAAVTSEASHIRRSAPARAAQLRARAEYLLRYYHRVRDRLERLWNIQQLVKNEARLPDGEFRYLLAGESTAGWVPLSTGPDPQLLLDRLLRMIERERVNGDNMETIRRVAADLRWPRSGRPPQWLSMLGSPPSAPYERYAVYDALTGTEVIYRLEWRQAASGRISLTSWAVR